MVFSMNENSRNLIVTKFGTRNILKLLRQDLLTSFSINIISIYRYSYLQLFHPNPLLYRFQTTSSRSPPTALSTECAKHQKQFLK